MDEGCSYSTSNPFQTDCVQAKAQFPQEVYFAPLNIYRKSLSSPRSLLDHQQSKLLSGTVNRESCAARFDDNLQAFPRKAALTSVQGAFHTDKQTGTCTQSVHRLWKSWIIVDLRQNNLFKTSNPDFLALLMSNSVIPYIMSLLSSWISLGHYTKHWEALLYLMSKVSFRILLPPPHISLFVLSILLKVPCCIATQSLEAEIGRRCSGSVWSSNMICLLYWNTTLQQAAVAVAVTWEWKGQLCWELDVNFLSNLFWQVTHTEAVNVLSKPKRHIVGVRNVTSLNYRFSCI